MRLDRWRFTRVALCGAALLAAGCQDADASAEQDGVKGSSPALAGGSAVSTAGGGTAGGAPAPGDRPAPKPDPRDLAAPPSSSASRATSRGLEDTSSDFAWYRAPAGDQPTSTAIRIDGYNAAILPNGRLVTPVGTEMAVQAPKPFGLAVSPDGNALATVNSGEGPFSITLIQSVSSRPSTPTRIDVNSAFMGVVFSPDSSRFYVSGGENGNVWVGSVSSKSIIGSVNLNGSTHPLDKPLNVKKNSANHFPGAFPGALTLSKDGRYLYVADQAAFAAHTIDTTQIVTGTSAKGEVLEPDNFAAVIGRAEVGRYPFGIALSPDDRTLYVANVGVFEFSHLTPDAATGDLDQDYPLCLPGVGYPDETELDQVIQIKKIDADTISALPLSMRDPDGIRCGYIDADQTLTIPGLGDPNVEESSSVYALDVTTPAQPVVKAKIKTGRQVGEVEDGLETYGASHPNAIAVAAAAIYVANGNNDSITVLDPATHAVVGEIHLSFLEGEDRHLRGIQPVALALSPDQRTLYVAEAGINAIALVSVSGTGGTVQGHIPTGWWPSAVRVSADGSRLFVSSAKGRGAGPHDVRRPVKGSAWNGVMGTVNRIDVPEADQLFVYTEQVLENNGFVLTPPPDDPTNPIPTEAGVASAQIKHVVFINKENATYDLLLGDITQTRQGVAVEGQPAYAVPATTAPNHHELALSFALSDNFYLEPAVSSDGHRWLTNTYTTEFEETQWPATYGGQRQDAGDDPAVYEDYPGRLGFSGAYGSPDPEDYNQHGSIYLHLVRNGYDFANFGKGFDLVRVDYDPGLEPTGVRVHTNVPMEKVVRDNSDHLYAEWNMTIPDSPLPEDPDRYNRYGRFKQVFEDQFVSGDTCTLPAYLDLYYPNDHGGGAYEINGQGGEPWDFDRYVQDNDAALGMTIDLIAHSPCWKDTVIFVTEDDTQNGFDHVDGYRAPLLVIGPWVKREYVSKTHTSLASIFKTIDLILGIPPLNLYDTAATDLRDFFTGTPDYTPYTYVPVEFSRRANPRWAELTREVDFSRPDADEIDLRWAIEETRMKRR